MTAMRAYRPVIGTSNRQRQRHSYCPFVFLTRDGHLIRAPQLSGYAHISYCNNHQLQSGSPSTPRACADLTAR